MATSSDPTRTTAERSTADYWICHQCNRTYAVTPRGCRCCGGTSFGPA